MSTPAAKAGGEAAAPQPTFSYAQAAKGRSVSGPTAVPSSKPSSGASSPAKDAPLATRGTSAGPATGTQHAEGQESHPTAASDRPAETVINGAEARSSSAAAPRTKLVTPVPRKHASTPPSPSFGTSSTSTLPKEEDLTGTPNASSESTWDKQSQASSGSKKGGENGTAAKANDTAEAEELEKPKPLTAAPLPAVNFWQKRKEAQEAKARSVQQPPPALPAIPKGVSGPGSAAARPPPGAQTGKEGAERSLDSTKPDPRRKAKGSGNASDDGADKAPQSSAIGKDKKKSSDAGRAREEGECSTPLGYLLPEPAAPVVAPPPVQDAVSWPTPDTVQDGERKKAMEKGEKEKTAVPNAKPHGKEKWTPVPYTPNVIFETQLNTARRGGRTGRGGRESGPRGGNYSNGNAGGDKAPPSVGPRSGESTERGRADSNASKGAPMPPPRLGRRSSSAGPSANKEQRRNAPPSAAERRKDGEGSGANVTSPTSVSGSRRTSIATQTDGAAALRQDPRHASRSEGFASNNPQRTAPPRLERAQVGDADSHAHPRSAGFERRADGGGRSSASSDFYRDGGGYAAGRDRAEGRPGRGGYRGGRGGSNGFSSSHQHPQMPFSGGQQANNGGPGPYGHAKNSFGGAHQASQSQHQQPPPSGGQFGPGSNARSYRGGARSQPVPGGSMFARPSGHGAPQTMAPLQTQLGSMYEYQAMQAMSPVPYSPFVEQYSTLSMVSLQLDYYFSVDNLCKDMFLRKHMDSQGFVFLAVIADFNRMRQLTQDIELVRYACLQSRKIEFRTGSDGLDRLRPREGWQQWVLGMRDRDATAQNDGPSQVQQPRMPHPQGLEGPYLSPTQMPASPVGMAYEHGNAEAMYVPMNGVASPFGPTAASTPINGTLNGDAAHSHQALSATVPNFSPAGSPPNGVEATRSDDKAGQDVFSDSEVDNLVIVVRKQGRDRADGPFHNAACRTYSNGSIDEKTIADAIGGAKARSTSQGNGQQEASEAVVVGAKSPTSAASPSTTANGNPPPVFWMKGRDSPIDSLPNDISHETYDRFRKDALRQRESAPVGTCHRDMDNLYQFWSHFLVRNFNTRMYDEFRGLALADRATKQSDVGLRNLLQYYDVTLGGQKTISDGLARDYVDLVMNEDRTKERLGFEKLRAAWRGGLPSVKNKKRIDSALPAELRAELDH
ncbi:MAG: hypothetical protein M1832_001068 [Thelocarpon impressellum]|nr:MAG: hypothetical protein M1832_001068 [Thelocarpon impressellum]